MSDFIRRLPVYLLLDCSGSMHGERIEAVKQGIKSLVKGRSSGARNSLYFRYHIFKYSKAGICTHRVDAL